jgi:hypothetical protein
MCVQAIILFFSMKVYTLTEYRLTDLDWELLDALYSVLAIHFYPIQIYLLFIQLAAQVPHMVQQAMLAELMPVLLGAVLSFEIFMTWWETLHFKHPALKPWVDISLKWAQKYYTHMDNTDMYVVVMCELLFSSLSNLNVSWQQIDCSQSSILAFISSGSLAIGKSLILGMLKPWLSTLWVLSCE